MTQSAAQPISAPSALPGRLSPVTMTDRPSGAKLGIFDLPRGTTPLAPFTLAIFHVPVGVTTSEDHHEVREIWMVQSGSGSLRLDGEDMRASAGDSFFFDSFRRHQIHNDGDEPIDIISIWWQP